MDFRLSDEQEAIRETFRAFADNEVKPEARAIDEERRYPRELVTRAGELGFFQMRYPEPAGLGSDVLSYLLAIEEIARASLSVAAACTMQSLMGTWFVHEYARGDLRERLVAPALEAKVLGTICMTEPDAGSDLFALKTRATERDGVWILDGQKTWVTSAPIADMFTVFAKTGAAEDRELSIFLVERGAPGLVVGRAIEKLGVRGSLTSEVAFDGCPATCMLGARGEGAKAIRKILAEIRVVTASLALGVGRAAFDDAKTYAAEREQFGKPICKFQLVQDHLAEMAVDLEAARQLTWYAAWRSDEGLPNDEVAAMAKLFASEAATRVCDRASRVLASYGFADEYDVQRYLRDVRFTLIGGGTSEILRVNLAKGLYR